MERKGEGREIKKDDAEVNKGNDIPLKTEKQTYFAELSLHLLIVTL